MPATQLPFCRPDSESSRYTLLASSNGILLQIGSEVVPYACRLARSFPGGAKLLGYTELRNALTIANYGLSTA